MLLPAPVRLLRILPGGDTNPRCPLLTNLTHKPAAGTTHHIHPEWLLVYQQTSSSQGIAGALDLGQHQLGAGPSTSLATRSLAPVGPAVLKG